MTDDQILEALVRLLMEMPSPPREDEHSWKDLPAAMKAEEAWARDAAESIIDGLAGLGIFLEHDGSWS